MPSLLTATLAATAALALAPSAPVATGRGLQGYNYDEITSRYNGADVGDHSGGYMFGGDGGNDGGDDHHEPEPEPTPEPPSPEEPKKEKKEKKEKEDKPKRNFHSESAAIGDIEQGFGGEVQEDEDNGDSGNSDSVPSSRGSGRVESGAYRGKSTNYDGFGPIVSGCGVPPSCYDLMMKDKGSPLLYVALNSRKADGGMGMFEEGKQCGRWIKVTLGKNCIFDCEHDDVDPSNLKSDDMDGEEWHAYVADECPDDNYWCKEDHAHLDMSRTFLDSHGAGDTWNGREVTWSFMDGAPEGMSSDIHYFWSQDSFNNRDAMVPIISICGVSNGISKVENMIDGEWKEATKVGDLGQQWELAKMNPYDGSPIPVKVTDYDGVAYESVKLDFVCDGHCGEYVEAPASSFSE